MPVNLVIFDCDGVLIDSEVISARMLISELEKYGVQVNLEYVARHFIGRSYPVVLSQIRKEFGVVLPDGFEADYRARLIEAFRADLKIMPGVREVLGDLSVPFCLATSSSPNRLRQSLELVGIAGLFEGRATTASEVEHGKPAPDLFLHAAEKLGTNPKECLVIEDSLAGIRAGIAAGMQVWHFTGGSHLRGLKLPPDNDAKPHRQFASFSEFFYGAPELKRGR
ncbi:MAG: HAD family hydrolase [Hyphomicrobiaceae bacterium]|nr:HAD family hydrolase [Hyphomicrobiaceae bacterium]